MATHPRILAWRIPWTEEPGGLQSMGLQRVGHNRNDSAQHTQSQLICKMSVIIALLWDFDKIVRATCLESGSSKHSQIFTITVTKK